MIWYSWQNMQCDILSPMTCLLKREISEKTLIETPYLHELFCNFVIIFSNCILQENLGLILYNNYNQYIVTRQK